MTLAKTLANYQLIYADIYVCMLYVCMPYSFTSMRIKDRTLAVRRRLTLDRF